MKPKTILVTGGAGYIGSHTCKALAQAGFFPVTYDNLSLGHRYAVQWGPLVLGDLRDKERLRSAFAEYKPDAVFHFASDALVVESMQNPGKYYSNNVGSSLALLEVMQEYQVSLLIFSSSCATYGTPAGTPIEETHAQKPINPYGRTKWIIEQMLADFDMAHGLKFVALRYFNAAGADLAGEIGEDHTPETHLIPSLLQSALGLRPQMAVFGTDFPTPDGSAIRDYIHVQDLADAHLLALQWLFTNKTSDVFNLGTGSGQSVFVVIRAIEAHYDKKLPIQFEKRRAGEPPILTANATKARSLLGWNPSRSDLQTLIKSAAKWQESPRFLCGKTL